jgi:hypothetical protein
LKICPCVRSSPNLLAAAHGPTPTTQNPHWQQATGYSGRSRRQN